MNETEKELQEKLYKYESLVNCNILNVKNTYMAIQDLLNTYEYDVKVSARKALEYDTTVRPDEHFGLDAKISSKFINDYDRIMWLLNVACDYCYEAMENLDNAYEQM